MDEYFIPEISRIILDYAKYRFVGIGCNENSLLIYNVETKEKLLEIKDIKVDKVARPETYISSKSKSFHVSFLAFDCKYREIFGSIEPLVHMLYDKEHDHFSVPRNFGRSMDRVLYTYLGTVLMMDSGKQVETPASVLSPTNKHYCKGTYGATAVYSEDRVKKSIVYNTGCLAMNDNYVVTPRDVYTIDGRKVFNLPREFHPLAFINKTDIVIGFYSQQKTKIITIHIPSNTKKIIYDDNTNTFHEYNISPDGVCLLSDRTTPNRIVLVVTKNKHFTISAESYLSDICFY